DLLRRGRLVLDDADLHGLADAGGPVTRAVGQPVTAPDLAPHEVGEVLALTARRGPVVSVHDTDLLTPLVDHQPKDGALLLDQAALHGLSDLAEELIGEQSRPTYRTVPGVLLVLDAGDQSREGVDDDGVHRLGLRELDDGLVGLLHDVRLDD